MTTGKANFHSLLHLWYAASLHAQGPDTIVCATHGVTHCLCRECPDMRRWMLHDKLASRYDPAIMEKCREA